MLNLKNPVVFLDLETTGMDIVKDRIVEIALLKIHLDGREEELVQRLNPEIPVSEEAKRIHGISNEDVASEPTFKEVAKTIARFIEGCVCAASTQTALISQCLLKNSYGLMLISI